MATLGISPDLLSKVRDFLTTEGIGIDLADPDAPNIDVRLVTAADRTPCEAATLYARGRITCAVALGMARRLGISTQDLGKMLDFLEIKVCDCSLGCF